MVTLGHRFGGLTQLPKHPRSSTQVGKSNMVASKYTKTDVDCFTTISQGFYSVRWDFSHQCSLPKFFAKVRLFLPHLARSSAPSTVDHKVFNSTVSTLGMIDHTPQRPWLTTHPEVASAKSMKLKPTAMV